MTYGEVFTYIMDGFYNSKVLTRKIKAISWILFLRHGNACRTFLRHVLCSMWTCGTTTWFHSIRIPYY